MSRPGTIQRKDPEPLYIADKREGFLNWFADVLFEQVVKEVEEEQAAIQSNNDNNSTKYENIPCNPKVQPERATQHIEYNNSRI